MADTKFTKGPWKKVDLRHQKNGQIKIMSDVSPYSTVANVLAKTNECPENANLITAAPELYEALRELADIVRAHAECWPGGGSDGCDKCMAVIRADAALAKAEGVSHG